MNVNAGIKQAAILAIGIIGLDFVSSRAWRVWQVRTAK